ncbi:MAG TPA: LysM peptidoglycan-binding domain-containing protein, partial [Thermodesulfovibrio thiophilus]|nr:LysM peptidoglycan-binding domain-containing protein [Thermodesulfovibrio thiophilus]
MPSYENPQVKFYIIKEGDTLESIWQQHPYLSSWKVLAEFNHLEYPYLVSPDTDTEEPASGYVIFSTNQVA